MEHLYIIEIANDETRSILEWDTRMSHCRKYGRETGYHHLRYGGRTCIGGTLCQGWQEQG